MMFFFLIKMTDWSYLNIHNNYKKQIPCQKQF